VKAKYHFDQLSSQSPISSKQVAESKNPITIHRKSRN